MAIIKPSAYEGWVLAENSAGKRGFAPIVNLTTAAPGVRPLAVVRQATRDYNAQRPDELFFKVHDPWWLLVSP